MTLTETIHWILPVLVLAFFARSGWELSGSPKSNMTFRELILEHLPRTLTLLILVFIWWLLGDYP